MKCLLPLNKVGLSMILTFLALAMNPLPISAQLSPFQTQQLLAQDNTRPSVGKVGTRTPKAGRGICPSRQPALTALVPHTQTPESDKFYIQEQTVSENPTLWFYTPYTEADALEASFVLLDSAGKTIGNPKSVQFPSSPGVISIQIPEPLKINQDYQWVLQIHCSSPAQEVYGWIRRVNSSSQQVTISAAKSHNQPMLWYDTLTFLGERRRTNPMDKTTASEWIRLLKEIGLEDIASQPITN